jgi:hypothetical protein
LGERRNAYEILVGKYERKRPLVKPKRRREDKTSILQYDMGSIGI